MNLKMRLQQRQLTFGSWVTLGEPGIAEIMAKAGFDWLAIDMEHGGLSYQQVQELIRVIDLCGVVPLVRVMENHHEHIKKVMDMGAHGVLVPLVNTKADAERAVAAVKYPPVGTRGVGLARAQQYTMDINSYIRWNQENSIIIAQVEHIQAVENLEEIMAVPGIDGFIIGLYDLSGSLGCLGDFEHPRVQEALERIDTQSKRRNYLVGQHVVNPNVSEVTAAVQRGVKFVGVSDDFLYLGESCRSMVHQLRSGGH